MNIKIPHGALIWLLAGVSPVWAVDPLAMTVTPTSGTALISGQPYRVHVETPGESGEVRVIVGSEEGDFEKIGVAPLEFDLTLPWDKTGPFNLYIGGWVYDSATGAVLKHSEFAHAFFAMPGTAEIPVKLQPRDYIGAYRPTAPANGVPPEPFRIGPVAVYADGRSRDVGFGAVGTTYTSSDPNIATVDADGWVTAVAPGTAFVAYQYRGLRDFVKISVGDSSTGRPPVVDYTSQVTVSAGGFRRDTVTGVYSQQVSIKNNGLWPIPGPIHLVISSLPQGVWMPENRDLTRIVEPIGSPTVFVRPPADAHFLPPGATATVLLKFSNINNLPITYTKRLFGGAFP